VRGKVDDSDGSMSAQSRMSPPTVATETVGTNCMDKRSVEGELFKEIDETVDEHSLLWAP
jgi:hypothetical protein